MTESTNIIQFKSKRFVPEVGGSAGLWAKKGTFDEKLLDMGWDSIPIEDIKKATLGLPKIMGVEKESGEVVFLDVTDDSTRLNLVMTINKVVSKREADKENAEQEAAGLPFRCISCPYCSSTLGMSKFDESAQVYCKYCESIFMKIGKVKGEQDMHLCSSCGLFSKPELFDYTVIWCVLFAYGVVEKREIVCKSCEHAKARRTCLINSIFLLGIPCALAARAKAKRVQDLPPQYGDLNMANSLVKKGDTEHMLEGIEMYEKILGQQHSKVNAGIRYNMGLAYMTLPEGDKLLQGARALEGALENCSNYEPAAELLLVCYMELGDHGIKARELAELFGIESSQQEK